MWTIFLICTMSDADHQHQHRQHHQHQQEDQDEQRRAKQREQAQLAETRLRNRIASVPMTGLLVAFLAIFVQGYAFHQLYQYRMVAFWNEPLPFPDSAVLFSVACSCLMAIAGLRLVAAGHIVERDVMALLEAIPVAQRPKQD